MMKMVVAGMALVGALGVVPLSAATHSIVAPARAIAAYASDAKAAVNVRGIPAERSNASRMHLKGRGMVLILR